MKNVTLANRYAIIFPNFKKWRTIILIRFLNCLNKKHQSFLLKKVKLVLLFCLGLTLAQAQNITISDGAANWTMDSEITGSGCSSNANFDSGNGIDQLFSSDWYIGVETENSQNFPPASSSTTTDTSIIALYTDLLDVTGLSAELTIIIKEFAPLDVQVAQIMQINNNTGSTLDIRLFNYLDLDKNDATTEDAVLFLQDDCNLITQVSNVSDPSQICYYAVNASDGYEILEYSLLCNKLQSGIDNLNNTGLPLLADDYTQALQFNATIPNGGISTGETLLTFGNPPEPAVIDINSGQCSFTSTPPPDFTIGQPFQNCNNDGSFTLEFAFSGEVDGTEYTFTETITTGVSVVTFIDDGSVNLVTLGPYPFDALWGVEVKTSFEPGVLNTFNGTGTCTPSIDCSTLSINLEVICEESENGISGNFLAILSINGGDSNYIITGDVSNVDTTLINIQNITDGTIDVQVEDGNACIETKSIAIPNCEVMMLACPEVSVNSVCEILNEEFTGNYVVTVTAVGGSSDYLINGDITDIGSSIVISIDDPALADGSIDVVVTDNNIENCLVPLSIPTAPCDVNSIPTLSQWGLILLSLILLSITTVSIIQNKTALASNGGAISSATNLPYFDWSLFKRMLLKSVPLMLLVFVLISFVEGGWFIRNLVGTVLSLGMVVYVFHFVMLSERFKNGQEK